MFANIIAVFYIVVVVYANDIFPSLPVALHNSENAICNENSNEYVNNLGNFTLWAYEMRDASSKATVGILKGSIYNMGDYTQCLGARAPFPTQHCLVTMIANVPDQKSSRSPYSLHYDPYDSLLEKIYKYEDISKQSRNMVRLGWCVPASCNHWDLEKYLNIYLGQVKHPLKEKNVTYTAKIPRVFCQSSSSQRGFDVVDVAFCIVTGFLLFLVILSSFMDFNENKQCREGEKRIEPLLYRILMDFSLKKNFRDLSAAESSNKALSVLYGIKTFAILMIIIDHRFGMFVGSVVSNFDYIEHMYRNFWASYLFHGDLFVDTFFVASGILVVYSLLTLMDKKYINPGLIIFIRYIRLTPAYAYILFFCSSIYYHMGNGPLWEVLIGREIKDCRSNWWVSLLYLSNYINVDHMCMVHTWYLPCDFHYFIIAVGVVLLLKKKKLYGLSVLTLLTILSLLIPFSLLLIYKRPPFLRFFTDFLYNPKSHPDMLLTYSKSHTRAAPYFIGMFAGYFYYKLKGSERFLSKIYTHIVVFISASLLLACMFTGSVFYDPYYQYNRFESATYGALHRPVWALGTTGFMFCLSYGTLKFLYKCLSWSVWIPLSKLVYGAYLWHFVFQTRAIASTMTPRVFNFFDIFTYGLADIFISFLMALALYLTVEAPVVRILKEIFISQLPEKKEYVDNSMENIQKEQSRL